MILLPENRAKSTKVGFRNKRLPFLDWPANSPHANLIENLRRIPQRRYIIKKNYS